MQMYLILKFKYLSKNVYDTVKEINPVKAINFREFHINRLLLIISNEMACKKN